NIHVQACGHRPARILDGHECARTAGTEYNDEIHLPEIMRQLELPGFRIRVAQRQRNARRVAGVDLSGLRLSAWYGERVGRSVTGEEAGRSQHVPARQKRRRAAVVA